MKFENIADLAKAADELQRPISHIVLLDQSKELDCSEEDLLRQMSHRLDVMIQSVEDGSRGGIRSTSNLTGGDAHRLKKKMEQGQTICGSVFSGAIQRALAVSELNAAMGRIVAAPTAGSCGILPAALLTMMIDHGKSKEECVRALFTASAVGLVIAQKASIAGAEGGCQAECGSASAMAAAAIVELAGGTPSMVAHSVAIALKSILGLVCDPVAGLVEVPCIKRNASGISNALCAAELALAGIKSVIPADEVISAMKQIGDVMSPTLKETAECGLATTPTGLRLYEEVFGQKK